MKKPVRKLAKAAAAPAFPITVRQRGAKVSPSTNSKAQKRENVFSKSRDTREDRSARQMKTSRSPQTFPHVR